MPLGSFRVASAFYNKIDSSLTRQIKIRIKIALFVSVMVDDFAPS